MITGLRGDTRLPLFCFILCHSPLLIRNNFVSYQPTHCAERVNRL
jgi:hypothetical protein